MVISVFSDGTKKDKVAEFYDTSYPCSFLRGVLTETQELEGEAQLMFVARQANDLDLNKALLQRAEVD